MNKKKSLGIIFISIFVVLVITVFAVLIFKPSWYYQIGFKFKRIEANLVNINNAATLEIKNDIPGLFLALANEKKFIELQKFFPKLFQQKGFNKVILHLTTDPEQYIKQQWGTDDGEVFSSISGSAAEKTITIDLFINIGLFRQRGYSERKIAQFVESRFTYGLGYVESTLFPLLQNDNSDPYFAQKIVTEAAKEIELEQNNKDDSLLFLAGYK